MEKKEPHHRKWKKMKPHHVKWKKMKTKVPRKLEGRHKVEMAKKKTNPRYCNLYKLPFLSPPPCAPTFKKGISRLVILVYCAIISV